MQRLTEMTLPNLPIDRADFGEDPMRGYEGVSDQHPWLAKFSQGYLVHGYQATKDLFAMDDKMSAGFHSLVDFYGKGDTPWGHFMKEMVLSRDGEVHKRLRASVAESFTPRMANRTRDLMRNVINELLDEYVPKGTFDFTDFASYFPVSVMCGLLGIPSQQVRSMRDALEMQQASLTLRHELWPEIESAFGIMTDFVEKLIADRETGASKSDGGLLDSLIASKNAGNLSELELRHMVLVLLFSGYDTSKNMLGATVQNLLQYPDYWARCGEDKAFCAKVVEELLRFSAPTTPYRQVEEDFVYQDVLFPKGTMLIFPTYYTGREASSFPDPLKFDPERVHTNRHVAFGRGPHLCLGLHIARVQLEEGLHLITQRLRNPHVAGTVKMRPFLGIWGPATLPITFETAAA